jgi:hypothetical protein
MCSEALPSALLQGLPAPFLSPPSQTEMPPGLLYSWPCCPCTGESIPHPQQYSMQQQCSPQ